MSSGLQQEQARLLFRFAPLVSISMFALQLASGYFLWDLLPHAVLLPWLGLNFLCSVSMLWLARRFARLPLSQQDGRLWVRRYSYLAFFQDATWGLIGPFSFTLNDPLYHLLTLFMLAGISAGTLNTRAVVMRTYVVSILALLLPTIVALALQGSVMHEGMLVLTLIYLLFMLSVARNYSANITRSILLWMDNDKLVEQLSQSKAELERSNRELLGEVEQRRLVEQDLCTAKERAERASVAKNQFLASVSHELRTPLNGIIGFTTMLEKEPLPENPRGYVGQIGKSANALLRIVSDILDITAIEAGQLKLYEGPFSLRSEVGEMVAILRPLAERKGLALNWHHDTALDDALVGDANRLRQVLSNLLSNAIKYTGEGEVSLSVRAVESRGDINLVQFEVCDTGIGIPREARARLFDTFTRIGGFETQHTEGVGLGLAIVRNLVERMGGTIGVESEPGQGSCFSVELPFLHDLSMAPVSEREQQTILNDPRPLQRLRVLVVDDNEINRRVLTAFLRHHAIACAEAAGGQEALEQIGDGIFDAVLLDIQMPEISGIEVAQRLVQAEGAHPTLIAVTAHAFPEQREEILAAGFSDLLIKPVSEEALLVALGKLVEDKGDRRAGNHAGLH